MNPTPKPWIDAIHAYIPGRATGTDGRALVKLSANENPYGCGDAARAALTQPTQPERYPDPDAAALRDAIAAEHGLDAGRIVCAAGSGDLLGLAAQAYAGPGDEVLYPRYSFSLYEIAARRCGATPVEAGDVEYGADVDTLLAAVTVQTRVVFLANPNNPTGTFLQAAELARLHDGLREDILLVLDHAYGEYVDAAHDDGGLALAQTADNVLMTRTFSKIHGLAGERIGWATGAAPLIATLNRIRGPFNVTTHGQAAATAAIADRAFVDRARAANARDRTAFCSALAALGNHGIRAVPSQANFVLVLFEGALTAQAALAALATGGYAVRHLPGQGLPHALRITIGTGAQMDEIAALIATAAHEAGK